MIYIDSDLKKIPKKYHGRVLSAIQDANRMLNDPLFLQKIADHVENFAMSFDNDGGVDGLEIVAMIKKYDGLIHVRGYKPWYRWSAALAKTGRRYPGIIKLNIRKLGRSIREIMATLIHEFIHILDQVFNPARFGHRGNSPLGKKRTAPRLIAAMAMDF